MGEGKKEKESGWHMEWRRWKEGRKKMGMRASEREREKLKRPKAKRDPKSCASQTHPYGMFNLRRSFQCNRRWIFMNLLVSIIKMRFIRRIKPKILTNKLDAHYSQNTLWSLGWFFFAFWRKRNRFMRWIEICQFLNEKGFWGFRLLRLGRIVLHVWSALTRF